LDILLGEKIQRALVAHGRRETADKPYLTVKETAKMARIAQSVICLYIRMRELKAHMVGERVIIRRADLERFPEANPMAALLD